MSKEEWDEFERTRGRYLLRALAKGMVERTKPPPIPTQAQARNYRYRTMRRLEEPEDDQKG